MVNQQFNVGRLPASEIKRIKMDCIKLGVSLGDYSLEAFRAFRANRIDDLRKRFEGRRKIVGRKVNL